MVQPRINLVDLHESRREILLEAPLIREIDRKGGIEPLLERGKYGRSEASQPIKEECRRGNLCDGELVINDGDHNSGDNG
jgi:hypothetical protein